MNRALIFLIFLFFSPLTEANKNKLLPYFLGYEFGTNAKFSSEALKGKIIYLDFWASWCSPCIESLPFLEKLHRQYSKQGFEVIAVNIDEKKLNAKLFLEKHPISYLNLYDPKGDIGKMLKVKKMPTAFLIDRNGNILFKHVGFNKKYAEKLTFAIKKILQEQKNLKLE